MLGDKHAAAAADVMQAAQFRGLLEQERYESAARLAALTRRLTHCMTKGEMIHVGELRRIIRGAEMKLRTIERMVDALKQRFPEVGDRRQA